MAEILIAIRFQFRTVVVRQERNRWRMNKQKGGTPSGRGIPSFLARSTRGGTTGFPSLLLFDFHNGHLLRSNTVSFPVILPIAC